MRSETENSGEPGGITLALHTSGPCRADGEEVLAITVEARSLAGTPVNGRQIQVTVIADGELDEVLDAVAQGAGVYVARLASTLSGLRSILAEDLGSDAMARGEALLLCGAGETLTLEVDPRPYDADGRDAAVLRAFVADRFGNILPEAGSPLAELMPCADIRFTADGGFLGETTAEGGVFTAPLSSTGYGTRGVTACDRVTGLAGSALIDFPPVSLGPPLDPIFLDPVQPGLNPTFSVPLELLVPPAAAMTRYCVELALPEDLATFREATNPYSEAGFPRPEVEPLGAGRFRLTARTEHRNARTGKVRVGEVWLTAAARGRGRIEVKDVALWGVPGKGPVCEGRGEEVSIEVPAECPGTTFEIKNKVNTVVVNAYLVRGGIKAKPQGGTARTAQQAKADIAAADKVYCKRCDVTVKAGVVKPVFFKGAENGIARTFQRFPAPKGRFPVTPPTVGFHDAIGSVPKPKVREVNVFYVQSFFTTMGIRLATPLTGTLFGLAIPPTVADADLKKIPGFKVSFKNNIFIADDGEVVVSQKPFKSKTFKTKDTTTLIHELAHVLVDSLHVAPKTDDDNDPATPAVATTNVLVKGPAGRKAGTFTDATKITFTEKQCKAVQAFK